jgi:hypothetical protein
MKTKILDVKSLVIGLLLGICVILAIGAIRGEAPQKSDADYRYQIGAVQQEGNGVTYLYILDHETNKVHRRQFWDNNGQGYDVKRGITQEH